MEGKASKRVAKHLKPVQGRKGGVLGGKALVALELGSGLAVARATPPAGETNAAKRVPALRPQGREQVGGTGLWVADRPFGALTQTAAFAAGGAHFLVRYPPKPHFCPDPTRPAQPGPAAHGRAGGQAWGWVGGEQATQRRFVGRLTLYRPGAETRSLLTALLAAAQCPAHELLDL